jgi:hypothetical protein
MVRKYRFIGPQAHLYLYYGSDPYSYLRATGLKVYRYERIGETIFLQVH